MSKIYIPEFAMVTLVGVSGAGKSTFANKHFKPTQILSSDFFRGMVSDDENNQNASADAFDILYYVLDKRLKAHKLTVIDAMNINKSLRDKLRSVSRENNCQNVAIILNPEKDIVFERMKTRTDRIGVTDAILNRMYSSFKKSLQEINSKQFRYIYILNGIDEINNVEIEYTRLKCNMKNNYGLFDIIGDIHGCYDELLALITKLGYDTNGVNKDNRKLIFLGDYCDRGPKNLETVRLIMNIVERGNGFAILGNHDYKLLKYLRDGKGYPKYGFDKTMEEFSKIDDDEKESILKFLLSLTTHLVFDYGKLVVSHAGIKKEMINRVSSRITNFCMFGDTTGETDDYGLSIKNEWENEYDGKAINVYGHIPRLTPKVINKTYGIDTACVFGGKLTAFRYPEKEFVSINSFKTYSDPIKPLQSYENNEDNNDNNDIIDISKIINSNGELSINTDLIGNILIDKRNTNMAIEEISRFAIDPKLLIYLPPTMSPAATSTLDSYLEYPTEAFEYYRKNNINRVICEKKHMGSRAIIIVGKSIDAIKKRFNIEDNILGIIYSRTGKRIFNNIDDEQEVLTRLKIQLDINNFWEDFDTDWVIFDAEFMPWSIKAQGLLKKNYAPVGNCGITMTQTVIDLINSTLSNNSLLNEESNELLLELNNKYKDKNNAINSYINAYRKYCWNVTSINDLRIAPFHILATKNKIFSNITHLEHLDIIRRYITNSDPIFINTEYVEVDINSEESINKAIEWWKNLTEIENFEGMVIKPEKFLNVNENNYIIQPAIKCRGREYLRIIYGPEYLLDDNLRRLKKRNIDRKREFAKKEFALGLESLQRFINKEPLYRIHECILGILGIESIGTDPRL